MQKSKYQQIDLTGLAVGLVITVLTASILSYVVSSSATTIDSIVNKTGVEGLNVSRIMYYGVDAIKSLTQFLPVFAIGSVAILLIGLFIRSKLGAQ